MKIITALIFIISFSVNAQPYFGTNNLQHLIHQVPEVIPTPYGESVDTIIYNGEDALKFYSSWQHQNDEFGNPGYYQTRYISLNDYIIASDAGWSEEATNGGYDYYLTVVQNIENYPDFNPSIFSNDNPDGNGNNNQLNNLVNTINQTISNIMGMIYSIASITLPIIVVAIIIFIMFRSTKRLAKNQGK